MPIDCTTSRRNFMLSATAAMVASSIGGRLSAFAADKPASTPRVDADQALRLLVEGNKRFADGKVLHPGRSPEDFKPLAQGQFPIAAILGCADSRVSPEVLFDQSIGDLFVVRVAGNYVGGAGASVKGSIEYAVAELNVPLVLVLGHSECGAVKAAIAHIRQHDSLPGAINDLVNNIKPAVLETEGKPGDPLQNAIEANVRRGVEKLRTLHPILGPAVKAGKIKVVGGTYNLASGSVLVLT